jgi:hypothetical protein
MAFLVILLIVSTDDFAEICVAKEFLFVRRKKETA